jgi:hypothetical protein
MQGQVRVVLLSIFSRHPAPHCSSLGAATLFAPHAVLIVPGVLQLLPALGHLGLSILPWDAPFGYLGRVEAALWPMGRALSLFFCGDYAREEPPSPESQDVLLAAEDEDDAETECREAEVRDYAPPVLD